MGFGFGKGPPLTAAQRAVSEIRADETLALQSRIVELEAEIKHLEENFTEWLKEYRKQGERVAGLEAALRKFDFYLIFGSDKDTDTLPVLIEHIRAARNALEKKG